MVILKKIILSVLLLLFIFTSTTNAQEDETDVFFEKLAEILVQADIYVINSNNAPEKNKLSFLDLQRKIYQDLGNLVPPKDETLSKIHYYFYKSYEAQVEAIKAYELYMDNINNSTNPENLKTYQSLMETYKYQSEEYHKKALMQLAKADDGTTLYDIKDKLIKEYKTKIFGELPTYIDAEINGSLVEFADAKPFLNKSSGRTMIPIRFVSESLGAEVKWEDSTRTITIIQGNNEIKLKTGDNNATVNGNELLLDSEVFIKDGRTYVPLRFVSEALGANVEWDGNSQTAIINAIIETEEKDIKKYLTAIKEPWNKFLDINELIQVEDIDYDKLVTIINGNDAVKELDSIIKQLVLIKPSNESLISVHNSLITAIENERQAFQEIINYADRGDNWWKVGMLHYSEAMDSFNRNFGNFQTRLNN
jgi:hypothetical protein